ncbi:uncharacterized protein LOC113495815 [Trichoplusia ni]|uniref:Uncharacterized protein LOC113495815 n=1 Tax=Trichoplusia ni TaxID=7111 RepID=A0A7E5VQK4_TRINI|nr:uncharacterized protein LOC113495815 [Trichoplusia ni]
MFQDYTYSYKGLSKTNAYCSKYIKLKCQARLKMNRDDVPTLEFVPSKRGGTILIYKGNTYVQMTSKTRWYCSKKTIGYNYYEIITFVNGKSLIYFQNYTFSYQGPKDVKLYPYCSKRATLRCKARLKLDKSGNIVHAYTQHNHPPPVLRQIGRTRFLDYYQRYRLANPAAFPTRREEPVSPTGRVSDILNSILKRKN